MSVSSPATNSRPRESNESRDRVWRLPLQSGGERVRFLAAGLCLIVVYSAFTTADYASKVLAASLGPRRVEQAAKILPINAAFQHLLGRISFFERQDFPAALEHYRRATEVNRYSARYWLDLANTQQIMSQAEESRKSLASALAADPTNPQVAGEAANYYLVLGDTAQALRLLAIAVRYSPDDARNAVELSWRATQDPRAVMEQVLPQTADGYMMLMQVLMERRETEAAAQVWQGLMALKQGIAPESTFPYLQYLLDQGEVAQARAAWDQLMRRDDSTRGYLSGANLVSNGNFEEEILNGGFDWRYQSDPTVLLGVDERESYRGRRSLTISFTGEPVRDAGIYQLLAVEPSTEYRISARVRTEGMEGAGGPQLAIVDAYTRKPLYRSADFNGTMPWQTVEGTFRTEPDSKLLMLRIMRFPGTTRIRGSMWLDEVSVVRQ